MGKSRRRASAPPRGSTPPEEKMEEPEPGELNVMEEADAFHERRVEEALAALGSEEEAIEEEEVEEVLGLELCEDSESEEDGGEAEEEEEDMGEALDMDSDLEEPRGAAGSGLPHESAWGQRKNIYYGTDYGKTAAGPKTTKPSKEEVEAEEQEEEEEAQAIQKRLAHNLGEDDYGLDLLQAYAAEVEQPTEKSKRKIAKDLQSLSKKEQLKLLQKESPELLELIQDFEAKLIELRDELEPLMQLVRYGIIPQEKGSEYIQTKYHLYLNYCCNISFYLVLKAKRIPVYSHPVIERLLTYRNLINDLGSVDQKLSTEVRLLLKEFHRSDGVEAMKKSMVLIRKSVDKTKPRTVHKISNGKVAEEVTDDSDLDEEAALAYYKAIEEKVKSKKKRKQVEIEEEAELLVEEVPDQKRGATYQIVKNKGLTPKRKKIDHNPRVKHREKFRRAKIRRKGQVRAVRREEQRYGGELSGIRAGVKKSIKLK